MNQKSNLIDFLDEAQVYLDFLSSSIAGLCYLASISDQKDDLNSIKTTLDYSVRNLKKLFKKQSELLKGGDNNAK